MEAIVYVVLDAVITGFIVFLAGKLTAVKIDFKDAVICVGMSSVLGFIPGIGWLLSIIAFFYLLKKCTESDIWPDLILLVLVSKLISVIALAGLGGI
ncbi:protein of unknown function [Microbulbifer thermotolerans]|uniref:DUF4112 domain-containing protein n=1 Tax=Microbulbifer thermotolerans TaxID=252514 RepID=UPI0008E4D066|nr:DUF4112 domain-containing protein [Microbulbifer thermotolerans]MCX2836419.1 DUF4112 domain-containing protein [Microbulbifer thermotolerans]WKT59542.1 DUF4112 domain-containing protein [Microbulbifer thermotolerans]SFC70900.1 protein of unknown function [Microbulbifer thermotolerans]